MSDRINDLAIKINEMLKNEEVVKAYHQYRQAVAKSDLAQMEDELKNLQKRMVNALNDEKMDEYGQVKAKYEELLQELRNNPLYLNYHETLEDLNQLLQQIAFIIDKDLNR